MIGTTEIIVIAATGLVLFGSAALPKFARSIGQAKRELEKGMKDGYIESDEDEAEDEPTPTASRGRKKRAPKKEE